MVSITFNGIHVRLLLGIIILVTSRHFVSDYFGHDHIINIWLNLIHFIRNIFIVFLVIFISHDYICLRQPRLTNNKPYWISHVFDVLSWMECHIHKEWPGQYIEAICLIVWLFVWLFVCLFIAGQGAKELWQALRGQSFAKLDLENKSVRPQLKVCIISLSSISCCL